MNGVHDFHPFMQEALRTGKLPSDEEIARVVGENTDSITRIRERLEIEPTEAHVDVSDLEQPDEERFRQKYYRLVDEMIAEWHYDNPQAGNNIPDSEHQRIEDYCRSQIQHEWKRHRQRLTDELDT